MLHRLTTQPSRDNSPIFKQIAPTHDQICLITWLNFSMLSTKAKQFSWDCGQRSKCLLLC